MLYPQNIRLNDDELAAAHQVAIARFQHDRALGLKHTFNTTDREGTKWDEIGACGEAAAHKAFGIPFSTEVSDNVREADLVVNGKEYEVRTTRYHRGHLMVKDTDPDHRFLILVVQLDPYGYILVGEISVKRAREIAVRKIMAPGRPPTLWVSQEAMAEEGEDGRTTDRS